MNFVPPASISSSNEPPLFVVGLGELLWDVFPESQRLGGAPANFAIHCQQMGATSGPVSCIGRDELGEETLRTLREMGVGVTHIARSEEKDTGTVQVSLDDQGKPSYQIKEDVAWDYIELTPDLQDLSKRMNAICFGSLGQRSSSSRKAIRAFVEGTPANCLRIFDVNLRQDYFSREIIEDSLKIANVLKVSDEELSVLARYFDLAGDPQSQLSALRSAFDLTLIAYTRGGDGSLIITADGEDDFPGLDAEIVDSVGAGDSFAASLCMGLLHGWSLSRINSFANKVAAFVCSQEGATPPLPKSLLDDLR
jgi:fructokinase